MPWILNDVNKPVLVGLGSKAMNDAKNCYSTEAEAKVAQRESCEHKLWIGIRSTGHIQCADCGYSKG